MDFGFLGKQDFEDMGIKLPFGLGMMVKPLMKELNRQMNELDKELRREQEGNGGKISGKPMKTSFKIHFGMPGQMPIEISSSDRGLNIGKSGKPMKVAERMQKHLPKIDVASLKTANKLPKKEPEAIVRRLSDSIIYEIKLPGVVSINSVGIARVAAGFEIKAFSNKELFIKHIDLDLKLLDFYLSGESLVLEFDNPK